MVHKWVECKKLHLQSSLHGSPQSLASVWLIKLIFINVWRISPYLSSLFLRTSVWVPELKKKSFICYPEKQHLKTPPLSRHFLANWLYSPLRQFFQPFVGFHAFPEPGTRATKSNPYVSFKIFSPTDIGNRYLENRDTKPITSYPFFYLLWYHSNFGDLQN